MQVSALSHGLVDHSCEHTDSSVGVTARCIASICYTNVDQLPEAAESHVVESSRAMTELQATSGAFSHNEAGLKMLRAVKRQPRR